MSIQELEYFVRSVIDCDEWDWDEIYDGNCFHLTSSELIGLLMSYKD